MAMDIRSLVLDSNKDIYSAIEEIIKKPSQDEPFYICDVSNLIWKVHNWRKLMPRVEIFFATKCNNSSIVVETFAALGLGFDCASKEEIQKILSLGVPPERIVFSNPTKLFSHLTYAAEVGVNVMTFDNEAELYKIQKYHSKAQLLLRLRCDDESARYQLGEKFGACPVTEASGLLKVAKSIGLNVIGIHFHVGCGCVNYMAYYIAIATAKKVFDTGASLGYTFKLLDIGGGYPGEGFRPLDKIAEFINKALEEHFPDNSVKIIAEPGKYCCNTAFKLVSRIHSKKVVTDHYEQKVRMYYMDVGAYNALFNILVNEYYMYRPVTIENSAQLFPSIVWGPTSDTRDRLSEKVDYLPELNIGDWLIFEEAGGYTVSITCEYNGFASPLIYTVINKEDCLLLTEKLQSPFPQDKFTSSLEAFFTGHKNPYSFRQKYF